MSCSGRYSAGIMKEWKSKPIVELGKCTQPHGIRGDFTFQLLNTEDSALDIDSRIILFPLSPKSSIQVEGEEFIISKIVFGHKVMAHLKGVDDRNISEAMVPFSIHMLKSDLPELDDGEVYLDDLIGLDAIHIESKQKIGRIVDIEDNGMQAILVIRGTQSFDIPFVDAFVGEIDIEAGTVEVNPPEYV